MAIRGIVILVLVMVGCSAVDKTVFEVYPPRPDEAPVGIYVSPETPPNLHKLAARGTPQGRPIGTIYLPTSTNGSWKEVMEEVKAAAREMGGDAILIGDGKDPGTGTAVLTATVYRR